MRSRTWTAALASAILLLAARSAAAQAADDPSALLRVFLRDGSALVSYGEPARVGNRVVFSMPTASTPNPPLHLIDLPADRVDWDRTERYANAARAAQYTKTQAELDYAGLSERLMEALNDVADAKDAKERLGIVERARAMLVDWPAAHYNYRQDDVRQMVGTLDEAIADLRAASGGNRFDLTLSTFTGAPPPTEALLPPLTLQQSIEQVLAASRVVDNPVERNSLLSTAIGAIERDKEHLPSAWVDSTRTSTQAALNAEMSVDRSYRALSATVLATADRQARLADVRGIERLLAAVQQRDAALGYQRPGEVASLLAAVQEKLDATRRLRLARDQWELRRPLLTAYSVAMRQPLRIFAELTPALESIKALAGSPAATLTAIQSRTAQLARMMTKVAPPDELKAAHALLVSATQLASSAVTVRRQAALANDMTQAWNASSAAAGALMLGARAKADIAALLKPPKLR